MPKRTPSIEPQTLTAVIEEVKRSYFIAEEREFRRVDDEAIIDLLGRIENISPAHTRHLGKGIEMSLVCARSFHQDEPKPTVERPSLFSVNLRGEQRSLMAYVPADAFWALASMIASGEVTHIEARFTPPRYGHGDLLSLHYRGHIESGSATPK